MKIPLEVTNDSRITVLCFLRAKHVFGQIKFFLDTGSHETIIGYGDVTRLKIPISKLTFSHMGYGFGGSPTKLYSFSAVLVFKGDNEERRSMEMPVYVAEPTKKDAESINFSYATPSILGTDFFLKTKLRLFFDPSNKTAYLEE